MVGQPLVLLVSVLLGLSAAAPTTYDQRQEGELNVKVDLDNFVILVARPASALDVFGSMADLFDSRRASGSDTSETKSADSADQDELELDKVKNLDDVSLDQTAGEKEVSKATDKKTIILVQEGEKAGRSLEKIVRALRNPKRMEAMLEKEKAKNLSGKYKLVSKVDEPQSLKLVGDAVENCGPGRSRDQLGICEANE